MKKFSALALLFVVGCFGKTVRTPLLQCEQPPDIVQDTYFRVSCQEFPADNTVGCVYVGYEEGQQCMAVLESKGCGTWETTAHVCGVQVFVAVPRDNAPIPDPQQETL